MGLTCPSCGAPGALWVGAALDVPGDVRADEISVQALACLGCGARRVGLYEASRRGGMDDELVDHRALRVSDEVAAEIARAIAACPEPRNSSCECASHRRFGKRDPRGRAEPLRGVPSDGADPLRYDPRAPPPPAPERPWRVPVGWTPTGDPAAPYRASVGRRVWTVRVNAFGAYPSPYSLLVDGALACDLDEWPRIWNRP